MGKKERERDEKVAHHLAKLTLQAQKMKSTLLLASLACLLFVVGAVTPHHAINNVELPTVSGEAECILCGIVVNEIEGMLSENLTQSTIMNILLKDTCDILSGPIGSYCRKFVNDLPSFVKYIVTNHTA